MPYSLLEFDWFIDSFGLMKGKLVNDFSDKGLGEFLKLKYDSELLILKK
jgi:hypothetical protein